MSVIYEVLRICARSRSCVCIYGRSCDILGHPQTRVWNQNNFSCIMERVNGEISMNPNDHCLISNLDWGTMQFSIVDEASLYERKKHERPELSMTKHCTNHRIRWQKKIDFSHSDPGGTLEKKLNDLKPLFSRKKNFANLADQNKQQPQEINMRVTYHTWPLSMKQTFDRHMSILFD